MITFAPFNAEVAQLVEHQLPKLRVAGSSPVFRSKCKSSNYSIYKGFLTKKLLFFFFIISKRKVYLQ